MTNCNIFHEKQSDTLVLNRSRKKYYDLFLKYIFNHKLELETVETCLCASQQLRRLSDYDRFGLPFGTKICQRCGLILLSPRLREETIGLYYNDIYWGLLHGDHSSANLTTGGLEAGHQVFDFIQPHLPKDGRALRILEVGCGNGEKLVALSSRLKAQGLSVDLIGCDYSEAAIGSLPKEIRGIVGGTAALEAQLECKADVIILSHVLEHFVDPPRELRRLWNLTHPETLVYVEVPGVCDLVNKKEYGYDYLLYSVNAHIFNFNLTSLRAVLEGSGYEFIVGTEFVRSLFRPKNDRQVVVRVDTNYDYILSCLERAEQKRQVHASKPWRLAKNYLKKILN